MEKIKTMYFAKKWDYDFVVYKVEERKNSDNTFDIKVTVCSGHVHNCGPETPHIVRPTYDYNGVEADSRVVLYDVDLKGFHQISKETYDKICELYDNYHKVFVETGRKIKKLIKK